MGDTPGNRRCSTGTASSKDRRNLAGTADFCELRVVVALVTGGHRGSASPWLGILHYEHGGSTTC